MSTIDIRKEDLAMKGLFLSVLGFNTLRTGEADLRFYVTTVQDGEADLRFYVTTVQDG